MITVNTELKKALSEAQNAVVLAKNGNSPVQAMALEYNNTFFWGVQYHPEFTASILRSYIDEQSDILISEGFNPDKLMCSVQATTFAEQILRGFRDIVKHH